nr:Mental retardation GTPase activating protein [Ipomoea batatas]
MAVLKRRNRDDDVESLAMANCVMLISRMDEEQIAMSGRVYECKTCRKKFHSFQALGGHRASHKRPRMPSEKKHVCTVCGLEFERGQALGGHMSKHRTHAQPLPLPAQHNNNIKSADNLLSDSKVVVKEQHEEKESFHGKEFWIPKGVGHPVDGDTVYDGSSRLEAKRTHQWLSEATEPELISNKKQAVDASVSKSASGIALASSLSWENSSTFQSVPNQFMDRLFGSDATGSVSLGERNLSPTGTDSNLRKKVIDEQFGNDSFVGLSMSYGIEEPEACISYSGLRKVKVNQVKDSDDGLNAHMEQNLGLPMNQVFSEGSETTFIPMGQGYGKQDENVSLIDHSYDNHDGNMRQIDSTLEKDGNNSLSRIHSFKKGDSSTIFFGGYQEEPDLDALGRPISSYEYFYNQSTVQSSETEGNKELDGLNVNTTVCTTQVIQPRIDPVPKNKPEAKPAAKKEAPNSFPSNVRSLIATGMLDGVPVKYISVSREELRGVIKGSGYLCGCQSCNYSKALNAYEFERHAGCKTKHPNNHIYFENGKTIYQIVQELRSTREGELFDAIQTVTGSPINQKAFRIWKESYQAATRELQRIYGKEELNM